MISKKKKKLGLLYESIWSTLMISESKLLLMQRIDELYTQDPTLDQRFMQRVYLRGVPVDRVNQVWSTDITYIKQRNGFAYLTAVIDWYSRRILSCRLSTTVSTDGKGRAFDNFFLERLSSKKVAVPPAHIDEMPQSRFFP